CLGGGLDLITACDLRYATADAFFVVQETNIGITADLGTLQRLPTLIPAGVARELAYTGRRLPAARARELGLVNEVFDDHDALLAGVREIAAEIAARSPLAVWGSKESLLYARDHDVAAGLDQIATWQTGAFQAEEVAEAMRGRAGGHAPDYPDLPAVPPL
ncbi:enoyl-CoA hydratase-related protein, partial [Frankia sp. AvcI1]